MTAPGERQQAVMVGAARRAPLEMDGDPRELVTRVVSGELGFDVTLEHRAGALAARVAIVERESGVDPPRPHPSRRSARRPRRC